MPSFERRFEHTEDRGHAGQFCSHNVSGYTKVQSVSYIIRPATDHRCFQTEHPLLAFTNWFRASNLERNIRKGLSRCCARLFIVPRLPYP